MRFVRYAAAVAVAALPFVMQPAEAAIFVGFANATGTTSTRVCQPVSPVCTTSETPDQLSFDFTFSLPEGDWTAESFSIYNPINYRRVSGTVVNLGNGAFRGENLSYFNEYGTALQCFMRPTNCTYVETRLSAPTFDVRQVSPPPVPEPATWGMMILGVAIVGRALRRTRVAVRPMQIA